MFDQAVLTTERRCSIADWWCSRGGIFRFVNYEGRRFGVPYRHLGKTVRVCRRGGTLYIYTPDLKECLTTHEVTWSRRDRFCADQYVNPLQPQEFPTQRVTTAISQVAAPLPDDAFDKFNFEREELWND